MRVYVEVGSSIQWGMECIGLQPQFLFFTTSLKLILLPQNLDKQVWEQLIQFSNTVDDNNPLLGHLQKRLREMIKIQTLISPRIMKNQLF